MESIFCQGSEEEEVESQVDLVHYTREGDPSPASALSPGKVHQGYLEWICAPFACRYCQVRVPRELLEDLFPGPVTLVMERSEELNKDLNPFTRLVGIRIPDHAFMLDLAHMFGGPLALTSANLSSQASSLSVEEFQDLWPHLSLVIDGGPIGDSQSPECRLGSTVVDLSVPGKFGIIRPGCALENTTEILQQKYGLLPSQGSCS